MKTFKERSSRKAVLVVCMVDSIHSARWLQHFKNQEIDFYLFASTPNRKIHSEIEALTKSSGDDGATYRALYSTKYLSILLWAIDLIFSNRIRGFLIARLTKKYSIDVIHAMELNHAGYLVAQATKSPNLSNARIISSVWGSDIFWFGRFKKHKKELKKILRITDSLISECNRDSFLAAELGFNGKFIQSPSLFGFDSDVLEREFTDTSSRNVILIKGYESFVGRASIALAALSEIKEVIQNFEVIVYSANFKTVRLVHKINREFSLGIKVYRKKAFNSKQMLQLFTSARCHVGISLSDGVPATLLESMVSGTFPIQTNTSCADQWVVDGQSALLVKPEVKEVRTALLRALEDDNLVDQAMVINSKVAKERLSNEFVSGKLAKTYDSPVSS